MYIVNLTYKKPLAEVDLVLEAHKTFLNSQFQQGVFLTSGAKVPRDGGVILAKAMPREDLQRILEQDPFYQSAVADYHIIEFTPAITAPGFDNLLD